MAPLAVTAVTNFILASEVFLLAGLLLGRKQLVGSAAWLWGMVLVWLGLGALLGGIDHGFIEPLGETPAWVIFQRSYWGVLGLMTLFVLLTTSRQFFPARVQGPILALGLVQLVVYLALEILLGDFLVVILNYAPIMVLFLVFNLIGLKAGTGSWTMIAGVIIMSIASALQALGVDTFSPVDRNGLYHIVAMVGVAFLYWGGLRLPIALPGSVREMGQGGPRSTAGL